AGAPHLEPVPLHGLRGDPAGGRRRRAPGRERTSRRVTMPGAPELPLIDVSGRARERGQAHGETMRGAITEGLELAREAGAGQAPGDGSQAFLGAARRWTPSVVEELRGIADGA